jgi:hypothetical protein
MEGTRSQEETVKRLVSFHWRFFADGCPWQRLSDSLGLDCSGTIDDCNVYGPCNEDNCAPYHFVRRLTVAPQGQKKTGT